MSDSWFGKIVTGVVIGIVVNVIVSIFTPGESPSSNSSPTRAYCFDLAATPRCPLLVPLPPGTPCFCPYQGVGYTGYL